MRLELAVQWTGVCTDIPCDCGLLMATDSSTYNTNDLK